MATQSSTDGAGGAGILNNVVQPATQAALNTQLNIKPYRNWLKDIAYLIILLVIAYVVVAMLNKFMGWNIWLPFKGGYPSPVMAPSM